MTDRREVTCRRWRATFLVLDATETVKAVMSYLFDIAKVNKVEARHDPANIASGRVMEKAGMVTEGLRRACVIGSCGPRDSQYHGLLRSEWRGQQADD